MPRYFTLLYFSLLYSTVSTLLYFTLGLAHIAGGREAAIAAFGCGQAPIPAVLDAAKRGLWSALARASQVTSIDHVDGVTYGNGHRVAQQVLIAGKHIDVALLKHPHGRGSGVHKPARLFATVDGKRIPFRAPPPAKGLRAAVEKEFFDADILQHGVPIPNTTVKLHPTKEGELKVVEHDVSGRHMPESEWLPQLGEMARTKGYLLSIPPFLRANENGTYLMSTEKVQMG